MKKFWGFIESEKYNIGLTGKTVFVYDKNGEELEKFKDLDYVYYGVVSPDEKILAVKSGEGRMAFYSLEELSLIKKFRFAKQDHSSSGNLFFSPDGKELYNIEGNINPCNSSVAVYDMEELTRKKRLFYENEFLSVNMVEYGVNTNEIYLLGYLRDRETGVASEYFVGKLKDDELCEVVSISWKTHNFYDSYKHLEALGFTEKAYKWSYIDMELDKLKNGRFSLENLWKKYSDERKK